MRPIYKLSTGDLPRPMDTYRLKVREWEKVFHANGNNNKAGVAILILGKIDFKTNTVMRQRRTLHNNQGFS